MGGAWKVVVAQRNIQPLASRSFFLLYQRAARLGQSQTTIVRGCGKPSLVHHTKHHIYTHNPLPAYCSIPTHDVFDVEFFLHLFASLAHIEMRDTAYIYVYNAIYNLIIVYANRSCMSCSLDCNRRDSIPRRDDLRTFCIMDTNISPTIAPLALW